MTTSEMAQRSAKYSPHFDSCCGRRASRFQALRRREPWPADRSTRSAEPNRTNLSESQIEDGFGIGRSRVQGCASRGDCKKLLPFLNEYENYTEKVVAGGKVTNKQFLKKNYYYYY